MHEITDDRLRLIFTCCHPALPMDSRVALTLRTVGGLSTREIARAFIATEPTIQQRLVRAKRKIRGRGHPVSRSAGRSPARAVRRRARRALPDLQRGLRATEGPLVRVELCDEAIWLGARPVEAHAGRARGAGLAGADAACSTRASGRARRRRRGPGAARGPGPPRWDRAMIDEGVATLDARWRIGVPGPYQVQAAIAALHAQAPRAEDTDWPQIAALYGALARARAVAGRVAEPRGGGGDGRRAGRGLGARTTSWPTSSTATTCSTPRAPICSAGWVAPTRPPTRTAARSSWRRTRRSARSSSDGSAGADGS